MYDNIPSKPRLTNRVNRWTKQVNSVLQLYKDALQKDKLLTLGIDITKKN